MRTIVTGASGFVGANLSRRLLREGHEVHLFLRAQHSLWRVEEIRSHVSIHQVDLSDAEAVDQAVRTVRPEWIFHLAAYGAYPSQTDLGTMVRTNVTGTMNLVAACVRTGFAAFVNTGSSSEYGFKDHAPAESEWIDPNSDYAVTKAASTLYCRHAARSNGVRILTLRLYSVFGPLEEPTRLVPTLIEHGLRGKLPPLADPEIARDFIYISDVEDAYLSTVRAAGADLGAIYNVGTGIQTTLRDAVGVARTSLKIEQEPEWMSLPSRIWDTSTWVADNRRIVDELQWRPRHTFEEGFRATVAWFLQRSGAEKRHSQTP